VQSVLSCQRNANTKPTPTMKHYYATESIGINANTNRRHCATYMRFPTAAERDEWVADGQNRVAIPSSDSDMRHSIRNPDSFWSEEEIGEQLIGGN